jgi:exodeoxyribonuclease-5
MLKDHIYQQILKELNYSPSKGQEQLIELLSEFALPISENKILLIKGYAGTGKTTSISAFINAIEKFKQKLYLITPTGRAAKVLSSYSGKTTLTIHKKIYRQVSSKDGLGKFNLDKNLHKNTIFIVDEASMISNRNDGSAFGSGQLLNDLMKYVFEGENCKLIIIGDTAQLPPVNSNLSPALDIAELQTYGYNIDSIELTEVIRQSQNSGILFNATKIRYLITENKNVFPKIEHEKFNDLKNITGEELIDLITESYDKYGIENTIVITRSNKRANIFNQGIRNRILWKEEEISVGDIIMIVKNNYYWLPENKYTDFIANGDIVEITRINSYEEIYDKKFANITVKFLDYPDLEIDVKVFIETLNIETASMGLEENKALFFKIAEDYADIKPKQKMYKAIKDDKYLNALQIKFAYAVTCHKAQGGQWKNVFIDHGYITEEMVNVEFLRWLYTAFTRAEEKVYMVNFNKQFFIDN